MRCTTWEAPSEWPSTLDMHVSKFYGEDEAGITVVPPLTISLHAGLANLENATRYSGPQHQGTIKTRRDVYFKKINPERVQPTNEYHKRTYELPQTSSALLEDQAASTLGACGSYIH
jgi:hypothetical protein